MVKTKELTRSKPSKRTAKAHQNDGRRVRKTDSGFQHVYAAGKRWQSRLKYRGEVSYVGVFDTPHAAAVAADCRVTELGWPLERNFREIIDSAPEPTATGGREFGNG